jgi:Invasion associated locus B (IalB) protein
MIHGIFSLLTVAAVLAGLTLPAAAQTAQSPTSLGISGDWETFTYESEGAKVCYATSAPKKSEASKKGVARDPVYFMITHWPSKKVKSQPSVMIGYKFKEASDVKLTVDGRTFVLYPVDNMAWTDKVDTEKAILAAMKTGKSMVVAGISAKGTSTKDTYSLSGISAAMDSIDSACK